MSNVKQTGVSQYDTNMRLDSVKDNGLVWHSPLDEPFHVAGLAWFHQERIYRRLPMHTDIAIPEAVNYLADQPAGGQIRFQTDSTKIAIRVKLKESADMQHMPASGQCGVDCYIGPPGNMEFCSVTRFARDSISYESTFVENLDRSMRNIVLNLPLYQGVKEILIGLDEQAAVIAPPAYQSNKKVVVYGTSVTQGGCASRPGMMYTNILSRRIPFEFINLGFSGNGMGEAEVSEMIAQIEDPALLVLDYEGNCVSTELFRKTLPAFIQIYRETHPNVPILIPSRIRYARENLTPHLNKWRLERKAFEQELVQELRSKGDHHIFFFDGSELLGGDDFHECTVDGTHPTDLGFLRMANGLEEVYRTILNNV